MKPCSRYLLKLLLFGGIFYGLSNPQCFGQEKLDGKVIFSSLDRNDITFAGLEVLIEGESLKRQYILGVEEFSISLPPGTYRITATCNNFYPFRRSAFRLKHGESIRINLVLALHVLWTAHGVNNKGAFAISDYAPKLLYQSFLVNLASTATPHLLIRFDKQTRQKGYIEYSSKLENTLMASYDTLSIYADKIRFDEKNAILEAEGNIVFEDGQKRTRHSLLRIQFIDGQAVIIPK